MTYSNHFVMAVLVDGKPQQELANNTVNIPFETEFVLRFRNKNNRRAVVKFFIDGENVSGDGFIIKANDHIDIKRHATKDCAFKFVSLNSSEAVDAGKNGENKNKEKGLIEAHFYLEKETPQIHYYPVEHHHHHHHYPKPQPLPYDPYPWVKPVRPYWNEIDCTVYGSNVSHNSADFSRLESDITELSKSGIVRDDFKNSSVVKNKKLRTIKETESNPVVNCSSPQSINLQDGCTVEGNATGQTWNYQWADVESTCTVLKLFLQGWEEEKIVKQRSTNKDNQIDDLEAENERLRKELAEIENEKLKKKLKIAKRTRTKKA